MQRQRGFTLLELLVVLVIIAVVAGVAAPRLAAVLPGAAVRGAGRTLASHMRYVYAYAISQRTHARLAINLDDNTYWAETFTPRTTDSGRDRVLALQLGVDFTGKEIQIANDVRNVEKLRTVHSAGVRSLPEGVEFGEVRVADGFERQSGMAYIEFSPWGYGDNALVEIRHNDRRRQVVLRGLVGEAVLAEVAE